MQHLRGNCADVIIDGKTKKYDCINGKLWYPSVYIIINQISKKDYLPKREGVNTGFRKKIV